MKIALAQVECKPGDVAGNVAMMTRLIERHAQAGADLVVFPEMCDTGYEMEAIGRTAGAVDGLARTALAAAARSHRVNVIAGLSLNEDGAIFNTAVALDRSGAAVGEYRKIHLFTGEPQPEDRVMRPGSRRVVAPIDGVPVGLMICYDLRFPELARSMLLDGAEMFVIPAAWPAVRIGHWTALLQARAIENQCVMVACNRVGGDGGVELGGCSAVFGPLGEAWFTSEPLRSPAAGGVPVAEVVHVDIEQVAAARARFRWLRDRRPESYRSMAGFDDR